ncbi:hypothetical protein PG997_011651 [Apiospora hydei]|uniref:Uncharacterized protein n=1 Tax=Apiospora hydei TaxID=1337664 RepID=A0ABR1VNM3_9PEZI
MTIVIVEASFCNTAFPVAILTRCYTTSPYPTPSLQTRSSAITAAAPPPPPPETTAKTSRSLPSATPRLRPLRPRPRRIVLQGPVVRPARRRRHPLAPLHEPPDQDQQQHAADRGPDADARGGGGAEAAFLGTFAAVFSP